MRTFIAVDCNNKEKIYSIQQDLLIYLSNFHSILKPVKFENLHFTLFFLGETDDNQVDLIRNKLNEIEFKQFEISYRKLGVFPSIKYPKIIWIGVDTLSEQKLSALYELVLSKMKQIGFRADKHFTPHLTIFRVKNINTNMEQYLNKYKNDANIDFSDIIDKIQFKKSELFSTGPIYSNILTIYPK
ncbi:MAG TPA: RNA 2',3'-cyclic phosphodiesterase [Nitrososphaeraceae archaeon]|nr:RNA 2',3'-cyclic phosphodiesterase [Nitrososphaeraceae archaeon]